MTGMPRENEPQHDDVERGVRDASKYSKRDLKQARKKARRKYASDHPHTETKAEAAARLGETSDEYGMKFERDLRVDMTEGQDIAEPNPDVGQEGPGSPELIEGGFDDATEDREGERERDLEE